MSDGWYIRKGYKTLGPMTEAEVRHVFETGRISPETPVRDGANAPWVPAGEALVAEKGQSGPAPAKRRLRTPIAIAIVATFALLVAIRWIAVRVGHRGMPPAVAVAAAEAATQSSAAAPTNASETPPAIESPAAPEATTPVPSRQPLIAKRPSPRQPSTQRPSQPKPAVVASKPKIPNVKIAPVIVPSTQATQADVGALELTALRSSTAKDALALYQLFQTTRRISPAAAELFKSNRLAWESRATQGLVRLGDQWVTATDAAKAHQEAAGLFGQAYEMTKVLNLDDARRTLETASRVDPDSIAADFTAGLVCSIAPARLRSPLAAERHFEVVLKRSPGYVPALNNLALVEIREEKYAEAVGHLREAANHEPVPEEVTQNLERFLSEAQLGRIHPSQPVLSEATELYSRLVSTKDRALADRPKHGWRYMALVLPREEREGLLRLEAPEAGVKTVVRGTGLVVEPHYILTCRHVVDDLTLGRADKIELVDPTDFRHERRLPATCVAVDEADDLCLLRCDGLNVPPVTLAERLPPRGSEVLLLDFLGGNVSRPGMKITFGTVTALPGQVTRSAGPKWLDFSRQLWCDAAGGDRAKGGALCDACGNVMAIHSTLYASGAAPSGKDHPGSNYVGGVPAPSARAFVQSSLPKFAHPALGGPSINWSKVEAKVTPSLVLVMTGYRKVVIAMSGNADASSFTGSARPEEADVYDDRLCTVCNGRARVRCRAPGCPFAGLPDEFSLDDPAVASARKTAARHPCPSCLRSGYVRCPHCSIGIDPLLR
jgi:S1-C subfamily serine protease